MELSREITWHRSKSLFGLLGIPSACLDEPARNTGERDMCPVLRAVSLNRALGPLFTKDILICATEFLGKMDRRQRQDFVAKTREKQYSYDE